MVEKRDWIIIQATLVMIGIIYLALATIITSSDFTVTSLNIALDVILIGIVLLAMMRGMGKWSGKASQTLLIVLSAVFIIFYILFKVDIFIVTGFNVSTLDYMIMGMVVAIGLYFAERGNISLITWENTQIWRDLFFMAVAIWFIWGVTAFLSVSQSTPFETTAFLGVPFAATDIEFGNDLFEASVKGVGGFLEGNIFFTFILGVLSVIGITRIFPETGSSRIITVLIISLIFGILIALLHTGLHDESQRATLTYISIFFIAGAITTLYFNTSFAFVTAHFWIDLMKGLFNTGNPQAATLSWAIFLILSAVGIFSYFMWRNNGKFKIK